MFVVFWAASSTSFARSAWFCICWFFFRSASPKSKPKKSSHKRGPGDGVSAGSLPLCWLARWPWPWEGWVNGALFVGVAASGEGSSRSMGFLPCSGDLSWNHCDWHMIAGIGAHGHLRRNCNMASKIKTRFDMRSQWRCMRLFFFGVLVTAVLLRYFFCIFWHRVPRVWCLEHGRSSLQNLCV